MTFKAKMLEANTHWVSLLSSHWMLKEYRNSTSMTTSLTLHSLVFTSGIFRCKKNQYQTIQSFKKWENSNKIDHSIIFCHNKVKVVIIYFRWWDNSYWYFVVLNLVVITNCLPLRLLSFPSCSEKVDFFFTK